MAQTVQSVIEKAYLVAQRKATPPSPGTTKHDALLGIADYIQKLWAAEQGVEWASLSEVQTIGTAGTSATYDLDDEVDYVSRDSDNPVLLTNGTSTSAYRLVTNAQLYKYRDSHVVAQVGRSLVFPIGFNTTDSLYGYDINVPVVLNVEDITSSTQEVQVDRPMWMAYMMAAEFVRNDTVKQGQYDNILALADVEMAKMKEANDGTVNDYGLNGFQAAGVDWS